jgi:hypothetical protein
MVAAYLENCMNPQDLLRATRDIYVLVKKPGVGDSEDNKFWSMRLHGLDQASLTASVKAFREQRERRDPGAKKAKALKNTALLATLSNALGAPSYERWLEPEQRRLGEFLQSHGMSCPADLISWSNAPETSLTAQRLADRLFNSRLPLPQRVFTGVGSTWLRAKGYGRLDLHEVSRKPYASDEELVDWCEQYANEVVLRAYKLNDWDVDAPEYLDLTGRDLLFQAFKFEALSCAYNMVGDNLVEPFAGEPELRLYKASSEEIALARRVFHIFRRAILESSNGWQEVLEFPGNPNLVFLRGADGKFDWLVRDQRDKLPPPPPLHPVFALQEHPAAILSRHKVALHLYFKRGEWAERLEHEADQRHYAAGGTAANWSGYEKLVLRELVQARGYVTPRAPSGPAIHGYIRHRLQDRCLMISPLVTVGEFWRFYEQSAWRREREKRVAAAKMELEADLASINLADRSDAPASVTWFDAIAYCKHVEGETGRPVRLLEVEEWREICPPPLRDIKKDGWGDLTWAVAGDRHRQGGTLHFQGDLPTSVNQQGLAFVTVVDFGEWLADYARGYACAANAATGRALMTGPLERDRCPAYLSMRYKGLKVGFRLCYVADSDA